MISIIIPALNEGRVLPRTLDSVFAQSYQDIEVIYINDASTDNTDEAIKPYLDRVTYSKHEKNVDKQITRNEGIALAKGEYLFVCDADVFLRPDCLEKMFKALQEHPECSFAYSGFKWEWKIFKSFPFDFERLKKMNYINMASLVRKKDHPGFDPTIRKFQDWDVWLTLALQGKKGYYIPEILYSTGENLNRQIRAGLSKWLPSFVYRIPWKIFGIKISAVEKYERGVEAIKSKHHI